MLNKCDRANEKGPSGHKIHHITKRYISQVLVKYLLSVNCKMLPMKLCFDGKNFSYITVTDH